MGHIKPDLHLISAERLHIAQHKVPRSTPWHRFANTLPFPIPAPHVPSIWS